MRLYFNVSEIDSPFGFGRKIRRTNLGGGESEDTFHIILDSIEMFLRISDFVKLWGVSKCSPLPVRRNLYVPPSLSIEWSSKYYIPILRACAALGSAYSQLG